jgi:DNA-binding CsgD family transcriptional regulator
MNIHHKNMKNLCRATEAWVQTYLSDLGIVEFGCNFIDLTDNTYLPLTSGYGQYCDFISKKLHHNIAPRIVRGLRYWNPNETLFQVVKSHLRSDRHTSAPTMHGIDWTIKTDRGFEMFCAVGHHALQPHQINALKHWIHVFSYEGAQIKKSKPKALLAIENQPELAEKYINFDQINTSEPFSLQKAKFGALVLTGKEQEYIQMLMLQCPYREIAAKYQVSEVAVRKAIYNIKCKLGHPNMPLPEMFSELNACGVLGACIQTIQQY